MRSTATACAAVVVVTLAALGVGTEVSDAGWRPCDLGQFRRVADRVGPVRILVMGNLGRHESREVSLLQERVAAVWSTALRRHHETPYDLGLTVGDNFVPRGVETAEDLRRRWRPYNRLGAPFFAALGDRDYKGDVQPQLEYTYLPTNVEGTGETYGTWNLPCSYYRFVAGPVEFLAIDTDEGRLRATRGVRRRRRTRLPPVWPPEAEWSAVQTRWVMERLESRGESSWRILYGHHDVRGQSPRAWASGLRNGIPVLVEAIPRYGVTAVLSGHDAGLWHEHRDGVEYFAAGGGDGRRRKFARCDSTAGCGFATDRHGFLEIEAWAERIRFSFFRGDGTRMYGCERFIGDEKCRGFGWPAR